MLRATLRIANVMAAEQQKHNIVIIGISYLQNSTSLRSETDNLVQVAASSAAQQHTSSPTIQTSTAKDTTSLS
jgi:hypothetical protein